MALWFKSVYCFVEEVSSVPSTHIKKFTTPDPGALTPLASRGTCAHGHVPPNRHRHIHMLENKKINLPNKCTNRGFTHSLYNMGALTVVHLVGKHLLSILKDVQQGAGEMAQGLRALVALTGDPDS